MLLLLCVSLGNDRRTVRALKLSFGLTLTITRSLRAWEEERAASPAAAAEPSDGAESCYCSEWRSRLSPCSPEKTSASASMFDSLFELFPVCPESHACLNPCVRFAVGWKFHLMQWMSRVGLVLHQRLARHTRHSCLSNRSHAWSHAEERRVCLSPKGTKKGGREDTVAPEKTERQGTGNGRLRLEKESLSPSPTPTRGPLIIPSERDMTSVSHVLVLVSLPDEPLVVVQSQDVTRVLSLFFWRTGFQRTANRRTHKEH